MVELAIIGGGLSAGLVLTVLSFVVLGYVAPRPVLELGKELSRRLAGMTRRAVRVAGHDIVYFERGKGEPVLLVHGFGANKDGWLSYARGLRGYRTIIPDLPGFGDSTFDPAERYGYAEQVTRLKAFVDALGLDMVHIAGNSMGGGIAGLFAATHPEHVRSLLLMDTAAVGMPTPSEFAKRVESGENPLIVRSVSDVDVLFDYCFHRALPVPKVAKHIFASEGMSRIDENETIFGHIVEDEAALERELGKIEAPTLVMWGKQDRVLDVSVVDVLRRHLATCRTVVYDGCGHLPYMEVAARAAADHRELLESA